jgi:tetratricopeptide (TPR) repeat protein
MQVKLNSRPRKVLFALVCLAAAGLYLAVIATHHAAARLRARPDASSLARAVTLEPWNAEPHWELGRYSLFVAQNPTAAVSNLEAAVALNPHGARYWLDLAAAYQVAGDVPRQRSALEQGLEADPTAPDVAWEAANFYLVQNDLARALSLFRVVMANDPEQLNAALSLCWRATKDVNTMLADAVPSEPAPYFAFLNLLTSQGETEPAEVVWKRLESLGGQFPASNAFPFVDYLIEKHEASAAVQVWQQLLARDHDLQAYIQSGNLMVDGSLEKELLNGGFDWRYSDTGVVQLAVDTTEFHGGNQSLRMTFTGPGVPDPGMFQYVPVRPDTSYHFSAYTKAEDVESASGPRLAVLDAYSGKEYALTDDSLGTTGWREQSADFQTDPESSLVIVKVTRVPGDPLIKGKFWIDDLSLVQR